MKKSIKKIELLAPAGNFEKLEIAIHYGADAVYLAGKDFSLRNFSGNFTLDEMGAAVKLAHENNVKVYVACNIFARNLDFNEIGDYLHQLGNIKPDAIIIADPGIFMEAGRIIPQIPAHLSTQANITNFKSVLFWQNLGIKRINIARELSLKDIKEIVKNSRVEIEAFVHGAMCISYSGRCLLSSFMAKRDSNRGMCAHPCRWKYSVVEELRPGKYMPISEDNRGSYIFNSYDLCMIEHIPEMIKAGLRSLKIEGRMKGINYLASTIKVYREAIDLYYHSPADYQADQEWTKVLAAVNNRGYCTGFYFNNPDEIAPNFAKLGTINENRFAGKIIDGSGGKMVTIEVRNKIFKGDHIEILTKQGPVRQDTIIDIFDQNGKNINFAQPGSQVTIMLNNPARYSYYDLLSIVDAKS